MVMFKYNTVDAGGSAAGSVQVSTSGEAAPIPPVSAQPAGAPPTTTPAAPAADWTSGMSQELKDVVLNKKFADPSMVVDSYRNLEKLLGAPKEKLMRLPDAPDAPEWNDIYQRLGKPENADGYKLEVPKEGGAPKEFVDWAKNAFHKANLTAKQAEALLQEWNVHTKGTTDAQQQAMKAQAEQNLTEMKTAWGNAYDQNVNIAKAGAKEFGASPEAIDAMEKAIGTKATMEFFHKIGSKLGEAQFVSGEGKGFGRMSPESAKAVIAQYKQDSVFMAKYMNKSSNEYKVMSDLYKDAYPGERSV